MASFCGFESSNLVSPFFYLKLFSGSLFLGCESSTSDIHLGLMSDIHLGLMSVRWMSDISPRWMSDISPRWMQTLAQDGCQTLAQDGSCSSGTYGEECKNQCECDLSHSTCDPTNGKCLCSTGWTGSLCKDDVDECANSSNLCVTEGKAHWGCKNSPGTYKCDCIAGYQFNGTICTDLDECAASYSNECNGSCTNTEGSYTCSCSAGYKLAADLRACDDIDECTAGTSGCQQKCTNEVGNFSCSCNTGYTVDETDRKKCYESAGFDYQVKVEANDVSEFILRETKGMEYLNLKAKYEAALNVTISQYVEGLKDLLIYSMKKGSIIIDFTTIVDKTVTQNAAGKMVEAILSIAEKGLMVDGVLQNASVTIGNITVPPMKDKCVILNALGGCEGDTECVIYEQGEAYCRKNDHKNIPLIVGLSVGLPLGVICIAAIVGCLWYKKKYTAQRRINVKEANYMDRPTTPKESISGSRPSSGTHAVSAWSEKEQLVTQKD
uniref:EGF-like domain-containing protein n=1 Tax=Biomphalaria glabrata TaxID=6526 RepID=A0A2C9KGH2_BIOGL